MFDFVGIGVLVLLTLLFGFLAIRSWRAKNAILKWGGVVVTGLLTLVCGLILILGIVGFTKLNARYDNPPSNLTVAGTPEQIERGKKLALICAGCHSDSEDNVVLSGTNFGGEIGLPIGALYAPNLTPAGEIKDWTDGELIRAIREGTHKDGRSLLVMPSEQFRYMSDEDVVALVAYLRSQPATGEQSPATQLNTLGALFMNLADFRTHQEPVGSVPMPAAGSPEYGVYLVDLIGCRSCHGQNLEGKSPDDQSGPPPGPNLTKRIPNWTEAEFLDFFHTGKVPSGEQVGNQMPWRAVSQIATDDDLKLMFAYLHSLQPVDGPAD